MNTMLTIPQYSEHYDGSPSVRTLNTWLKDADRKLPGAKKIDGKWAIPLGAHLNAQAIVITEPGRPNLVEVVDVPEPTPTGKDLIRPASQDTLDFDVPATPGKGWVEAALDQLPVYVPLAIAAKLLGVSEYTIETHPEEFGAVKRGFNGGWAVPQGRIRKKLKKG